MSQSIYPFDPHGSNALNDVTETRPHPVTRLKVIIPVNAPFFTTGFEIKQGTKVLKEGVDFYFGNQYLTGTHRTAQRMCGSIWIINTALVGPYSLKYHTLGGDRYSVSTARATTYLANELKDPISESWEDVLGSDVDFPPVDIKFDRDNFIWETQLVTAIEKLSTAIVGQDVDDNEFVKLATLLITEMEQIVTASGWNSHLAARGAVHGETYYSAGALSATGVAQNSNTLEGKSKAQLVTHILAAADLSAEVAEKFPLNADRTMEANMVLRDTLAHIAAVNGAKKNPVIDLSNGNSSMVAENAMVATADQTSANPGEFVEMRSGNNVLRVTSTGNVVDDHALTYNGQEVLTVDTLPSYVVGKGTGDTSIVSKPSTTLTFSGKGTQASPLKADVTFPRATISQEGIATIQQDGSMAAGSHGISQKAATDAKGLLDSLVPKTRTVAGKPLSGNIVLDKGDFGLSNVDDVADDDMPLNQNHYDLIADLVFTEHTHTASELVFPYATLTKKGLVQYATDYTDREDVAIRSDVVESLNARTVALLAEAKEKLPNDLLSITRYGQSSYLPIPALGSYPAAGVGTICQSIVGEYENSGVFVFLRNGADEVESDVFYSQAFIGPNGITKVVPTTVRYRPDGLKAGHVPQAVIRGSEGVFVLKTTGGYYLILTNGTMDVKYHKAVFIANGDTIAPNHGHYPLITADRVVLVYNNFSNGGWDVSVWTVPLADVKANNEVTFVQMPITSPDRYGNVQTAVGLFKCFPIGHGANAAEQCMFYQVGTTWTTINIRHANYNYSVGVEDDKIRICGYITSYLANSSSSMNSRFNVSLVVDLTARSVTLDDPNVFPMPVLSTGVDHKSNSAESIIVGVANFTSGVISSKGKQLHWWLWSTQNTPGVCLGEYTSGLSPFEATKAVNAGVNEIGPRFPNIGNYGSTLHNNLRHWHNVIGNRAILQDNDGITLFEYDPAGNFAGLPGFGPKAARKHLDWVSFVKYRSIPYMFDGTNETQEGFIFRGDRLSGEAVLTGETFSDTVTLAPAAFANIKAAVKALAMQSVDPLYFIEDSLSLYMHRIAGLPMVGVYTWRVYNDASKTSSSGKSLVFTFTTDRKTGTINTVTFGVELLRYTITGTAIAMVDGYSHPGSSICKMDDGKWCFSLNDNAYTQYVGYACTASVVLVYDTAATAWQRTIGAASNPAGPTGQIYNRYLGHMTLASSSSGEAIYGDVTGKTLAAIVAGATTRKVLQMTRVAEGWQVYFTEVVTAVMGGAAWSFPRADYDLRTLFPGAYTNSTFYIYADVSSGAPTYVFTKTKVANSDKKVYVGYCTTGTVGITELRIDAVTSMLRYRELEDHINSRLVHGLESANKNTLGFSKVVNKGAQFKLQNIGFADVFNSWQRFSHNAANWNQPANAVELNSWTYAQATDTLRCTANSGTYIGFVSNEEFGDYVFDVELGVPATSTDADNDAITLVIAYKVAGGYQRTISVVRSQSTETHVKTDSLFGVYYDYQLPDQKKIASVVTTDTLTPWKGRFARIRVVRVGNKFTVTSTAIQAGSWASAVDADFIYKIEFTLDDMPELAPFKGLNRFGYGAISQLDSTYHAFVRPDSDDSNYYATVGAVINDLYWQQNIVVMTGTVVDGGVVPLPAGFAAAETMTFLYPHRRVEGNPSLFRPVIGMNVSFNESTRVVTATMPYNGGTDSLELAYQVLAMPGGSLLK